MNKWTQDELETLGGAEEVEIAGRRRDGTLGSRVTIWVVAHDHELWVRSAVRGHDAGWYKAVQVEHAGRIWAAGLEKDVAFVDAGESGSDALDAAYLKKYKQYAGRILDSCLTPEARATTLKVVPVG